MELCNLSSITIQGRTINRFENHYNPNLKEEYKRNSIMTRRALEEYADATFSKFSKNFFDEHRKNLLLDKANYVNGIVEPYKYTINESGLITFTDDTTDVIYIPTKLYTVDSVIEIFPTNITVSKEISKMIISDKFTTMSINTANVLTVYFAHLDLSSDLSSNCFYVLGNDLTYEQHGLNESTLVKPCKGTVLGKDYFEGIIDESRTYGNFSNVDKVFVYVKCFPDDVTERSDRVALVAKVLNIDSSKVILYNNLNDIYIIDSSTTKDFEYDSLFDFIDGTVSFNSTVYSGKLINNVKVPLAILSFPDKYQDVDVIGFSETYINTDCEEITHMPINSRNVMSCTGNTNLVSLNLNSTKEFKIQSDAFKDCINLSSVDAPNCKIIDSNAFDGCSSLEEINVVSNLTSINGYTFYNCGSLKSINLLNCEYLSNYTFYNCTSLTNVRNADKLTKLNSYAFYGCSNLTRLDLQNVNLEFSVFQNCSNLVTVNVEKCTGARQLCFANCTSLTSFNFNGCGGVGNRVFQNCSSLLFLEHINTFKTIWYRTFENCTSLTSLNLSSCNTLDKYVFNNCRSLEYIILTNSSISLNNINDATFANIPTKTLIYVAPNLLEEFKTKFNSIKDQFVAAIAVYYGGDNPTIDYSINYDYNVILLPDPDNLPTGTLSKTGTGGNFDDNVIMAKIEGIETLGQGVLQDCNNLKIVEITDVKTIESYAFQDCIKMEKLTLGNSLETISSNSFQYCSNLKNIIIPDSVTEISSNSFNNCSMISSLSFGTNLEKIGEYAFSNCKGITSIDIPDSVTLLDESSFRDCSNVCSLTIGSSLKTISQYAFYNCSSLTYLSLSDNIEDFDDSAFMSCSTLDSITLPDSLTKISNNVFNNCNGLSNIIFNNNIKIIGDNSISNCGYIEELLIPNSVTEIGSNAFASCTNLTYISISECISKLQNGVLNNCTALSAITIPISVTYIEDGILSQCSSLERIYMASENTITFDGTNGENIKQGCKIYVTSSNIDNAKTYFGTTKSQEYILIGDDMEIVYYGGIDPVINGDEVYSRDIKLLPDPTNPPSGLLSKSGYSGNMNEKLIKLNIDGVTYIEGNAFADCYNLTTIIASNTVENYSNYLFSYCTSLYSIDLSYCKTCESGCFSNCSSLSNVNLPVCETCESYCFDTCNALSDINLPSCKTCGSGCFNNCESLTSVSLPVCETCDSSCFFGCSSLTQVSLPSCTSCKDYCFILCTSLTQVSLPSCINIGNGCFEQCSNIAKIYITSTNEITFDNTCYTEKTGCEIYVSVVNYVNAKKYFGTDNGQIYHVIDAETVYYGGSNPTIPNANYTNNIMLLPDPDNSPSGTLNAAQYGSGNINSKLVYAEIDGVDVLSANIFNNYTSLTTVSIGSTLTSIESGSFQLCSNLKNITLGNNLEKISYWAFDRCSSLTAITIPDSVTELGDTTFPDCSSLSSIKISSSLTKIQRLTFDNCYALTSIDLSSNITCLEGLIFNNCTSLKDIFIYATSVIDFDNNLGAYAEDFATDCTIHVNSINLDGAKEYFKTDKGQIYTTDFIKTIYYGGYNPVIDYSINYGMNVKLIPDPNKPPTGEISKTGDGGDLKSRLVELKLDGVNQIYCYGLCEDCTALTSLTIGDSVKVLDYNAFYHCANLQNVTLGNSIWHIRMNVFAECYSLTSITLPESLEAVESSIFWNCSNLGEIRILSTSLIDGLSDFDNNTGLKSGCHIYVKPVNLEGAKNYFGTDDGQVYTTI